ncbi:MAG: hypothetical protein HY695_11860 [Deltaproteobacteria bacterium]|nr:hypothetical protein [Deltaproteobacteria bacterium]
MKLASLEVILGALKRHDARYLIAGGLAVAAHGYGRLTIDVDLVVQLETANVLRALEALGSLGYRPVAPVPVEQFADPAIREAWIREKNRVVFGLHNPQHPDTPIDIFATEPFDFEEEFERALVGELAPGLEARFVQPGDAHSDEDRHRSRARSGGRADAQTTKGEARWRFLERPKTNRMDGKLTALHSFAGSAP